MKKLINLLLIVFILTSCSKDDRPEAPSVNQYLNATTESSSAGKEFLKMALSLYPDYSKYASLPQSDVKLLRVSYTTEYPAGKKIPASGVFVIPSGYRSDFPTVIYLHGSIYRNEAPSRSIANPLTYTSEVLLCAVLSSSFNCAVLIPDYVGYGESEAITHPYIHAASLGQASLDLIHAFREYTAMSGVNMTFNPTVFITGYSEGGYAAVALQKKITETSGSNLQVLKTVAGSGAYDNVEFARAIFAHNSELDPHMLATYLWAIGMYKTDYAYSKSYAQLFSDDDNAKLQSIDYEMGYFATEKLSINTNPALLFRPEFREGVLNGTDTEFLQLLKANSLVDFVPRDSLIFIYGTADTYVYPENTINAYQTMAAKGCKVKLYEYANGDHYTTLPAYLDIVLGRLKGI